MQLDAFQTTGSSPPRSARATDALDRRERRLATYHRYNGSGKGRARNARYDSTPSGIARKRLYERTVRAMMRAPGPGAAAMVFDLEEPYRVRASWAQVVRASVERARERGEAPERIAAALRWAMLPARLLNPPTAAYLTGPDDLLLRPSEWQELSQGVAQRTDHLATHKQTLTLPEITRIGRALALLRTDNGVRALAAGGMDTVRQLAAPTPRQL
jgi:hypothetical protein